MAVATVDGLAKASVQIGRNVHRGEFIAALDDLEVLSSRLHKFLNYVALAEVLLCQRDPEAGLAMRNYKQRVFAAVDGVTDALSGDDAGRFGVEMARGLSTALLEYRGVSGRVEMALGHGAQRMAA